MFRVHAAYGSRSRSFAVAGLCAFDSEAVLRTTRRWLLQTSVVEPVIFSFSRAVFFSELLFKQGHADTGRRRAEAGVRSWLLKEGCSQAATWDVECPV